MMRWATNDGSGPVLAGLLALPGADDVLRRAFGEADARATAVTVLATGAAARAESAAAVSDAVARWSEKYPERAVTLTRRPEFDAAIALTAATTGCVLAVLAEPADARTATVVASVERRAHCPVVVLRADRPYAKEAETR